MELEDNFKEKLEGRRLSPTASAWDRIEKKLDTTQRSNHKQKVLWMSIAASFVFGVFLTVSYYSQSDTDTNRRFVESPSKKVESTLPGSLQIESEQHKGIDTRSMQPLPQKNLKNKTQTRLANSNNQAVKSSKENRSSQNVLSPKNKILQSKSSIAQNNSNVAIETPLDQQQTNKPTIDQERIAITNAIALEAIANAEAEELLRNLSQKVNANTSPLSTNTVVNANDLLLDVEAEVDPDTFKDKIFNTIKKEFGRAVEAVANREN